MPRSDPTARPAPPNVVYVDCHDLGDWLGCYGRAYLRTPNLDRLAAQGAVFDRWFATAPICIPSRTSLFTGHMPHASGVFGQDPLDGTYPCLPELFRRGGYRTALAGGLQLLPANTPRQVGFSDVLPAGGDGPERARAAAAFLREQRPNPSTGASDATPFFLCVSFFLVHRPYGPQYDAEVERTVEVPPYLPDEPVVRRDLASFAHNIAQLDACAGTILDALRDAGLHERTVVVFTTEHGAALARAKHVLYDSGIKTALLMRYPPVIRAGTRRPELLSNVDLLPTLLELAGLDVPAGLLGRSFASALAGGPAASGAGRNAVFAEHTWGRRSGMYRYDPSRCVRTARHKLIRNFERRPPYIDNGWLCRFLYDRAALERVVARYARPLPPEELYDVIADPHELHNLAPDPAHAPALAALRARLDAFLRQTHDPILLGPVPDRAGMAHVPQWIEQPDGSFRLSASEPVGEREKPFPDPPPPLPAAAPAAAPQETRTRVDD